MVQLDCNIGCNMSYPTESGDGSNIFGKFVDPNAKLNLRNCY